MKKLIDIPDEHIRNLKMLAYEADTSVKSWLESVVVLRINSDSKRIKKRMAKNETT